MLGVDIRNALMPNRPPIDIEPPNQHASKSDFLFEWETVTPNTEYARALEQIFEIIGINARVRKPAEWAISQLTEEDLGLQENTLGSLFRDIRQEVRSQGILGVAETHAARSQKGPLE